MSRHKKRTRRILYFFILLTVIMLAIGAYLDRRGHDGGEAVSITVNEGETLDDIAQKLRSGGVVRYPILFRSYMVRNGMDTKLQSGEHELKKRMGYQNAALALTDYGKRNDLIKLIIPEGYEIYRIAEKVEEVFGIPEGEFLKTAESVSPDFLSDIPRRENRLEGYLFPSTYEFYPDASAEEIIGTLLDGFKAVWSDMYASRAKELGMTMDDVIKLASVIEREAADKKEMSKVSSVFHNRLAIGMPLQSCATVQYILKERKPVLSVEDTRIDSPYNTYRYPGLPVGPIASPGEDSIRAALYPEDTPYYYFKLNADGITVFSETLDEHNQK